MQALTSAVQTLPAIHAAQAANVPAKPRRRKEVVNLHRTNLKSLIEHQDGRFVSVTYAKQDGSTRILTGRLGVTAFLRGGCNKVMRDDRPYLTAFDVQIMQYRTVDLASVSQMRADNKVYNLM